MRFVLLTIAIHLIFFGAAQRIKNFNLYSSGSVVNIKFVLTAGSSCEGFDVLHSLDSIAFTEVYEFAGVCGLAGSDDPQSAVHNSPVPGSLNYYRIRLSTVETSEIKRIFVNSAASSKLSVSPNPVPTGINTVNLKFVGADNAKVTGYLCDTFGVILRPIELFTNGDSAELDIEGLNNGVYLVRLSKDSERFMAKCVVLQ